MKIQTACGPYVGARFADAELGKSTSLIGDALQPGWITGSYGNLRPNAMRKISEKRSEKPSRGRNTASGCQELVDQSNYEAHRAEAA